MYDYVHGLYETIVESTSSELILFFIILAIVVIPLYALVLKSQKAAKQHERERERQIIAVIKENSAVIASLKTTLDNNGASMREALERVHVRLDEIASKTTKVLFIVSRTLRPSDGGQGDNQT